MIAVRQSAAALSDMNSTIIKLQQLHFKVEKERKKDGFSLQLIHINLSSKHCPSTTNSSSWNRMCPLYGIIKIWREKKQQGDSKLELH